MRPWLLALLAAAALAAQPSFAALNKCTTKEGKTVYTDGECADDAKKAEVTIRDSKGVDSVPKGVPASKPSDRKEGAAPDKGAPPPPDNAAPDKGAPEKAPPDKPQPPKDRKNF